MSGALDVLIFLAAGTHLGGTNLENKLFLKKKKKKIFFFS